MKHLLAKSTETPDAPRKAESLVGHTLMVMKASEVLVSTVGSDALKSAGLQSSDLERLRKVVRLAAFVHDLGKASEHFQKMVRGSPQAQLFRHEAVSLWLCWSAENGLTDWLRTAVDSEVDFRIAVLAAAGHHRKFPNKAVQDEGAGIEMRVLSGHSDFRALLTLGAKNLGIKPPPVVADLRMSSIAGPGPVVDLKTTFRIEVDDLDLSHDDHQLLGITKALVINSDVIGSALPKTRQKFAWVERLLTVQSTGLESVIQKKLGTNAMRPFQQRVAESSAAVTLVKAGCGSGKTVAAWAWSLKQHPGRQLWVCYPTTGTTTEGFRDYVEGADIHGFIEHGRSKVDVELFGLQEGLEDDDVLRDAERLRALRQWGADAITCTVDTVLGLLQNQRKGTYAFPGLIRGAVVFDEIHAFDDKLFGLLLSWLKHLPGIPVLLMTASLPASRLAALRKVVLGTHQKPMAEVEGPPELESLPRYRRDSRAVDLLIPEMLDAGGKVLVVNNTVKRCMANHDRTWARGANFYHSRFRYCDRVGRHADVINSFRGPGAALALTTQVAEMSLDLSADLLVTELAPIPALIQRLGRLNRRSTPEAPQSPKSFVVIEPPRPEPYEPEALNRAREWLQALGTGPISQKDLVDAWKDEAIRVMSSTPSRLFTSAYMTEPKELREASPGVTIVLERDRQRVLSREVDVVAVAIPMNPPPRNLKISEWDRVAYHPVAPAEVIAYDERGGGRWL